MSTLTLITIVIWSFMAGYYTAEKSLIDKLEYDREQYSYKLNQCLEQIIGKK